MRWMEAQSKEDITLDGALCSLLCDGSLFTSVTVTEPLTETGPVMLSDAPFMTSQGRGHYLSLLGPNREAFMTKLSLTPCCVLPRPRLQPGEIFTNGRGVWTDGLLNLFQLSC